MPTKSTTFRSNTFSLLALALISVTLHPGCNEDKIRSLDTQLSEANKRVEAFKKDAIDARNGIDDAKEKARVAQQAAEDLRKQLASKQEDIDNLFGLKELGADVKRDAEGNVVSVSLLSKPFTKEQFALLKNFPTVKEVYIDGPSISVDTFKVLKELPQLTKLEASVSGTNTECLQQLVGLKNLTYLQLKRTSVNDESMAVLAQYPSIQQIRVGQTKVGDEGLKYLEGKESITALDLTD